MARHFKLMFGTVNQSYTLDVLPTYYDADASLMPPNFGNHSDDMRQGHVVRCVLLRISIFFSSPLIMNRNSPPPRHPCSLLVLHLQQLIHILIHSVILLIVYVSMLYYPLYCVWHAHVMSCHGCWLDSHHGWICFGHQCMLIILKWYRCMLALRTSKSPICAQSVLLSFGIYTFPVVMCQ